MSYKSDKKARRRDWLIFGWGQLAMLVLSMWLGGNDTNSGWSCLALILSVTTGVSLPFLFLNESFYQEGHRWE